MLNSTAVILTEPFIFVSKTHLSRIGKKSTNYNLVLLVLVRQPKHSQSWLADSPQAVSTSAILKSLKTQNTALNE